MLLTVPSFFSGRKKNKIKLKKPSLQVRTFYINIRQRRKLHIAGAELPLLAEIYSSTEQLMETNRREAL